MVVEQKGQAPTPRMETLCDLSPRTLNLSNSKHLRLSNRGAFLSRTNFLHSHTLNHLRSTERQSHRSPHRRDWYSSRPYLGTSISNSLPLATAASRLVHAVTTAHISLEAYQLWSFEDKCSFDWVLPSHMFGSEAESYHKTLNFD